MTDSQKVQITQVEKERREREEEFAALLLLFLMFTYLNARRAIQNRRDPVAAAMLILYGVAGTRQEGLARFLTPLLTTAWVSGYQRTAILAGVTNHPAAAGALRWHYQPLADTTTNDIAAKVTTLINGAVSAGTTIEQQLARLKLDFGKAGYLAAVKPLDGPPSSVEAPPTHGKPVVESKPFALTRLAQRLSYGAYNDGWWSGWQGEAGNKLSGFEHMSVIDERTSEICHARDHVRLPKAHRYWLTNWAPLHAWCRSLVFPYFGNVWTPDSDLIGLPPPTPGYGAIPLYVLRSMAA